MAAINTAPMDFNKRIQLCQRQLDILLESRLHLQPISPEWQRVQQTIESVQKEIKSLEEQKLTRIQLIKKPLAEATNIRKREADFLLQLLIDNLDKLPDQALLCSSPNEFVNFIENKWIIGTPLLKNQVKNLFGNLVSITRDPVKMATVFFVTASDKYEATDLESNGIELSQTTGEYSTNSARKFVSMLKNGHRAVGYHSTPSENLRYLRQLLLRHGLNLTLEHVDENVQLARIIDGERLALEMLEAVRNVPEYVAQYVVDGPSEYTWNANVVARLVDRFVSVFPHDRDMAGPYHIYFETGHDAYQYAPKRDLMVFAPTASKVAADAAPSDIVKLAIMAAANLNVVASLTGKEKGADEMIFLSLYHEGPTLQVYICYYVPDSAKTRFQLVDAFNLLGERDIIHLIWIILNAVEFFANICWSASVTADATCAALKRNLKVRTYKSTTGLKGITSAKRTTMTTDTIMESEETDCDDFEASDFQLLRARGYSMRTAEGWPEGTEVVHPFGLYSLHKQYETFVCKKLLADSTEVEYFQYFNSPAMRVHPANRVAKLVEQIDNPPYTLLVFPRYNQVVDGFSVDKEIVLTRDMVNTMTGQLMEFVSFIHGHQIAHRDIKPENLALDQFGDLIVLDLGLSGRYKPDELVCDGLGTLPYLPSDFAERQRAYSPFELDQFAMQKTVDYLNEHVSGE